MQSKITYREDAQASKRYKESYLTGIETIIKNREQNACGLRDIYCKEILQKQEKYREDFKAMLGWPLTERRVSSIPKAKIEKLSEDENCDIYRVSIEVLDGYSITGLLFQKDKKKRPLVIAQHGALGTPELIGNLYGDTYNYNQMIERMLNYDVNVFAPQLLIWDASTYQVPYEREIIDARLKSVGSSITALEVYGITRVLDYFEAQEYVTNFGMIGLSYGGFYTLFTAAIDTRIKSAVMCSFSNRSKQTRCDWTWFRSMETFSDAEIACLIYPRKLCLEMGDNDELFNLDDLKAEIYRIRELSSEVGEDWFDFIVFKGTHEFCLKDEPLKRLAEDIQ